MYDVGIVIGTFGTDGWNQMGENVKLYCENQPAKQVVHYHGINLGQARNTAIDSIDAEWIICVDADDMISSTYVEEMFKGTGDIRQPKTQGVYEDGSMDEFPVLIPERNIFRSNHMVIGSMFRKTYFDKVGGFDETLPALEDWDLWLRMIKVGAKIGKAEGAIYYVNIREGSRNQNSEIHNKAYRMILRK